MAKGPIVLLIFVSLLVSCGSSYKQREIEKYNNEYIVSKMKLPKDYVKTYKTDNYRAFYLNNNYGLRLDSNYKGKLNNIYLYDKISGIQYIIKNFDDFENIVNNKLPSEIIVYYYEFCTVGSGVENEMEILNDIKAILLNKNIKFAFSEFEEFDENYDPELEKIVMDRCLGG